MTIGNVDIVKTSEFYPKGRKLKCSVCLYGSSQNCPIGIVKRCSEYLGWLHKWKYEFISSVKDIKTSWDKTSLFEIIDNKDYYDRDKDESDDDARWYVYCDTCGYIPYKRSAFDECMNKDHFVQCNYVFSEIEIQKMIEDKKYSDWMKDEYDEE